MAFRIKNESIKWLNLKGRIPPWSRKYERNTAGIYRDEPLSKLNNYDVEIEDRLWSLWGSILPERTFLKRRLRCNQYLAIYVVACCAASVFDLIDWTDHLLDRIVISGNRYFRKSIPSTKGKGKRPKGLDVDCALDSIKFVVYMNHVSTGTLYRIPTVNHMNLADALIEFFKHYKYGILSAQGRSLAFGFCEGAGGGYFMYDCQAKDHPLFNKTEGASYMLRTHQLHVLHYCIVVTLNVPIHNVEFTIHRVEVMHDDSSLRYEDEIRILNTIVVHKP